MTRDMDNWSIQKRRSFREKVACCLLHSLSRICSGAEYLVSLLTSKEAWSQTRGKDAHAVVICK